MTELSIVAEEGEVQLSVSGHAGFKKAGDDIVCAACSVLCETLDAAVEQMMKEKKCEVRQKQESEAFRIFRITYTADYKTEVLTAIKTVVLGFLLLGYTYPEYVKISIVGDM